MIGELMAECKNYFDDGNYVDDVFTIDNCMISPNRFANGAYIAVTGSTAHDGVYRIIDGVLDGLQDDSIVETFDGRVWQLHPPASFVRLAEQVKKYADQNPVSAVVSESFGDYSYTKATGSSGVKTWQEAYKSRINQYRRMYTEVRL